MLARNQHARLAREQAVEPRPRAPTFAAQPLHDGHRNDNKQVLDVALADLRGAAKFLFAAARVLSGSEA